MTARHDEATARVGRFADLFKPDADWVIGGFGLPDGSVWSYREPGAVVIVQNRRLRVSAVPLTRSNDQTATVYGRLPFPGVPEPRTGDQRYFCLFKELDVATEPGQWHDYRITYDQGASTVRWWVDDELVNEERNVPDTIRGFTLAVGLMTEKDFRNGKSVSLHGQGVIGEWSESRITLTPGTTSTN